MIMCEHMHAEILIMEYFLMLDSLYNLPEKIRSNLATKQLMSTSANLHFNTAELTRLATSGISRTSNIMIALGCVQPLVPWKRQDDLDVCHICFDGFHVCFDVCRVCFDVCHVFFDARYLIYISQTESLPAIELCICVLNFQKFYEKTLTQQGQRNLFASETTMV